MALTGTGLRIAESATATQNGFVKPVTILILLALVVCRPASAADLVEGTAFVIDGDTIEINDERIRLHGIDAPELAQRCTEDGHLYPCLDASQALRKQIGRMPVSCVHRDTDRYGRTVALCTVAGIDISRWMVQQGQAIAFRKYSLDYVADEDAARAAEVGIWAGEFQDPRSSGIILDGQRLALSTTAATVRTILTVPVGDAEGGAIFG